MEKSQCSGLALQNWQLYCGGKAYGSPSSTCWRLQCKHISKHISTNNILMMNNMALDRNCPPHPAHIDDQWLDTYPQHEGTIDVIFLDFQKAFDRVPHQRLNIKLQYYGITGDSLNWIMSLLTNRKQAVIVNGSRSSWMPVSSGVPQGSVIGPALFLLYINDINTNIQSKMRLFADDSVIYRQILSEEDHATLQQDLNILADWSTKWLMGFNIKKCAILTITRKRNPSMYQYTLLNEAIPRTECYKYLGINISKDLRWNTHCQSILLKANKTLGTVTQNLITML